MRMYAQKRAGSRGMSLPGCGEGQRAVDKIAEIGKELRVVLGRQIGPFEVGVGCFWAVAQQEVPPYLHQKMTHHQPAYLLKHVPG